MGRFVIPALLSLTALGCSSQKSPLDRLQGKWHAKPNEKSVKEMMDLHDPFPIPSTGGSQLGVDAVERQQLQDAESKRLQAGNEVTFTESEMIDPDGKKPFELIESEGDVIRIELNGSIFDIEFLTENTATMEAVGEGVEGLGFYLERMPQ